MNALELPPEVIGHMAGLGGTNEPFFACPSCQRALIYATLLHIGAAGVALRGAEHEEAFGYITNAIQFLLEFTRRDFDTTVDATHWSDEDWEIAVRAFYQSRCEHFTDPETGNVVFEPHDEHGGRWDLVGADV